MSEQLGEALLVLRTDDRGLDTGVDKAKGKAEGLGKTLDATSDAASKMGKMLGAASGSAQSFAQQLSAAASSGDKAAKAFIAADGAITQLARAQAQATDELRTAKAAYESGSISIEKYNEQVLQTRTGLALIQADYSKQVAALGKALAANDGVTASHGRMSVSSMMVAHSIRSASDSFAAGLPITMILTEQVSRLAEAASLAGDGTGALGRLGRFMAGPWGMAITIGASVLIPLIGHLLQSSDAADKTAKSAQTMAEKLDAAKHTYEQLKQAVADYNAEQRKANETELQAARLVSAGAQKNLENAISLRKKLAAQLADLQQNQSNPVPVSGPAGIVAAGSTAVSSFILDSRIAANAAEIKDLQNQAKQANANLADELSKLDTDHTAKIRENFKELRDQAKATITDVGKLRARLDQLRTDEQAQIDAAQKAKRAANQGQFGREIDFNQAKAIATDAGFKVTSDLRTRDRQQWLYDHVRTPDNPVAVPGTSAHEKGNALDIAFGPGVSIASIKKAFEDEGVKLTKILTEAGHFHIQWSTTGTDKVAADAKRAADEAVRHQEAFNNEKAKLDGELLQAQRQGLTDVDAIAASQSAQVEAERKKEALSIDAAVKLGTYSAAQGKLLAHLNDEVADAQLAKIARDAKAAKLAQLTELQTGLIANQIEQLRQEEGIADTAAERRAIELKILDLEQQSAEAKLQQVIADAAIGKATAQQAQIAQDELNRLHAGAGDARQSVLDHTAGPIEAYTKSLQLTGAQRDEKVQGLVVSELEAVNQSIDDAITSRLGIKDPLLSGLIDMLVKDLLLKPMAEALQRAEAAGGGGGGIFGSLLGAVFGGGGGLLSGALDTAVSNNNALSDLFPSADLGGNAIPFSGFHADGGLIPTGSFGIVGERGPEPIFSTPGGIGVMPNSSLRAMGGGSGPPGKIEITVSGARGNAEIAAMVQTGVAKGLAAYDANVGSRVQDNLARRG